MSTECSVKSIDHLVLTVTNVDCAINFYTKTLGMSAVSFGDGRKALHFGSQKINLHQVGKEFKPHAHKPISGSVDVCFVTQQSLDLWIDKLNKLGVAIEEGPVPKTGAIGPMNSVYIRDPDENLIEIAYYD